MAGSTWYKQRLVLGHWDHPRVGGEHWQYNNMDERQSGSPPRWRGAPVSVFELIVTARITPALAGST